MPPPQLRQAVVLGYPSKIGRLARLTLEEEPDRSLVVLPTGVKPDYVHVAPNLEFLTQSLLTSIGGQTELHVAHYRCAFMDVDAEYSAAISGQPQSLLLQCAWARAESDKASSLWHFSIRAIKRSGQSRCDELNVLKAIRAQIMGTPSAGLSFRRSPSETDSKISSRATARSPSSSTASASTKQLPSSDLCPMVLGGPEFPDAEKVFGDLLGGDLKPAPTNLKLIFDNDWGSHVLLQKSTEILKVLPYTFIQTYP